MKAIWKIIPTVLLSLSGVIAHAASPFKSNPPNEPAEIIDALIARDFRNLGRVSGWMDIEYSPLFESFPPYVMTRVKDAKGKPIDREEAPTFAKCSQRMIVKSIKVGKVLQAPDPTAPAYQPKGLTREVLVTVDAEVLALELWKTDAIPEDQRCSWLGLEVQNTKTGKREAYFDNLDDDQALLKMMKQFGPMEGRYVIVEPHRRHWSYAISMVLPISGKGLKRHYDRDAELGNKDFIDAAEPRWLIQEPYPPEGLHIDAAIKDAVSSIAHNKNMAIGTCRFALAEALHVDTKTIRVDLASSICQASASVQSDLKNRQNNEKRLEVLQRIRNGANHE
jgi:hypothetical protein